MTLWRGIILNNMAAELEGLRRETIDLRQQAYDLLSQVREPSIEEKEALKEKGIKFLAVAIKIICSSGCGRSSTLLAQRTRICKL